MRRFLMALEPVMLGLAVTLSISSQAGRAQDATPTDPASAGTPVATSTERIVTLALWYQLDAEGELLEVGPLATNAQLQAGPGDPAGKPTGSADFDSPDNVDEAGNELPRITIGDSVFDAYAVVEGDVTSVNRWLYFDDTAGLRPASLVMQIVVIEGPYQDMLGTATWISRDDSGTGVLVIVLREADAIDADAAAEE